MKRPREIVITKSCKKVKIIDPSLTAAEITKLVFDNKMANTITQSLLKMASNFQGLRDAIELFELSSYTYCETNRSLFYMLADLMLNKLCQTIYDARLRSFSDYSEPSEPIDADFASHLISLLADTKNADRVRVFFNALANLRPYPPSQKYLITVDVEQYVLHALSTYCKSIIKDIKTADEYISFQQRLQRFQTFGGDILAFDAIKESVAANIEKEDFASTRNYDQLMREIWNTIKQPQINLGDFKTELLSSHGYLQLATSAMATFSPFMTPLENDPDATQSQTLKTP